MQSVTDTIFKIVATLSGVAILLAFAGSFIYWVIQRVIETKFSQHLEDYRHLHSQALQNEKLRLDLYNRRFEIYSSIFDVYDAMLEWKGTPEQRAAKKRFFRAQQESAFLFDEASGIEQLLINLNKGVNKVVFFKENSQLYASDYAELQKRSDESQRIQLHDFEEGLSKLKTAMREYIDFSAIK